MLDSSQQFAVAEGLRGGCRQAWAALFAGYSADVWRLAARQLGADAAGVADVVQETFLAAARSARGFDAERGTLWSWLAGIAQNQVAAHWKQLARAARVKELAESGQIELRTWLEGDCDEPPSGDVAELVRSVLVELPAEYAALLAAKYWDELSLADLAAQFGGTVEGVKSKLARARREFRGKFERLSRQTTLQ